MVRRRQPIAATLRFSRAIPARRRYVLRCWSSFARFLGDDRICLNNNAAEPVLRGLVLGPKAWLFARSDRGAQRAAFLYSLIVTAKLNHVDPQAGLADVLACISEHPANRLDELLPQNWPPCRRGRLRWPLQGTSSPLPASPRCSTRTKQGWRRSCSSWNLKMAVSASVISTTMTS